MRHENYKSDLALEVILTLGGVEIPVPDHDFMLVFYTTGKRNYKCVHKGDKWDSCNVVNGRLNCFLDNHGLGAGVLQVEYYDYIPDADFKDGDQLKVVPRPLDIELIYGAGDDATLITAEVATDITAAVARANAISADLENKVATDYYRGVGVESAVQTKTSLESGGENEVTITLTDGEQSKFVVHNGGIELGNYYTKYEADEKLLAKADLVDGKVPVSQLPDIVDDVLEGMYKNGNFYPVIFNPDDPDYFPDVRPYTPERAKIYIETQYHTVYHWDGREYKEIVEGGGSEAYTKAEIDALLAAKQATLVSGTNIKTVNNQSLLGIGNIEIQGSGGGQVQSDWAEADTDNPAYIKNKPSLAAVATSGSYNDLSNKPTIPDVSGKQDKRKAVYVCDIEIFSGGELFTAEDLADELDNLYADWRNDILLVAAYDSITANISERTISNVTLSNGGYAALVSAGFELDTQDKGGLNLIVSASPVLGADTYNLLGTTDSPVPTLPANYDSADEFVFSFTCATDNCVLTLPSGVQMADGFDFSADRKAGVKFQVSIMDGIAGYLVVSTN